MKIYILILLIAHRVFALDIGDRLKIQILEIHPHNLIHLNRGLEDGINVTDHAMLKNVDGYAARAVCLKTSADSSYWKIYRIVDKSNISKDLTYDLVSIKQSEIAPYVNKNDHTNFHHHLHRRSQSEKDITKLIDQDTHESVNEYDARIFQETKNTSFWDKNFNTNVIKREVSQLNTHLFISPYTHQSINGNQTLHYGINLQNTGIKYGFYGGYEHYAQRMKDVQGGNFVRNEMTHANLGFEIRYLSPAWSVFTETQYRQVRYGEIYTPKDHYLFGLIGFKYHFLDSKTRKSTHLSYIPMLERRVMEKFNGDDERSSGLRHGIRFQTEFELAENVTLHETLWYRPYHDLATWGIDWNDNFTQNELKLSYEFFSRFYLDYSYTYIDDQPMRSTSNIPRTNNINTIEFRYNFKI